MLKVAARAGRRHRNSSLIHITPPRHLPTLKRTGGGVDSGLGGIKHAVPASSPTRLAISPHLRLTEHHWETGLITWEQAISTTWWTAEDVPPTPEWQLSKSPYLLNNRTTSGMDEITPEAERCGGGGGGAAAALTSTHFLAWMRSPQPEALSHCLRLDGASRNLSPLVSPGDRQARKLTHIDTNPQVGLPSRSACVHPVSPFRSTAQYQAMAAGA